MTVEMPAKPADGEGVSRAGPARFEMRVDDEYRSKLIDLWQAYSRATERVWTMSDVIRRCILDAHSALVRQRREAADKEDEAWRLACGKADLPQVSLVEEYVRAAGDNLPPYHPPRKARKGGGSVIDWDRVRKDADDGNVSALLMLGGKAKSKKERMRDQVRDEKGGET